jgi:hypothetical protein
LCEHHHRLKHQAPGWTLTGDADGGLTWTTPGGIQVTTRPPGFGTDDDLVPVGAPPVTTRSGRVGPRSRSDVRSAVGGGRGEGRRDAGSRLPGIADLLRGAVDRRPTASADPDDVPPF